jgi:hypothetical protein
MTHYDTLEISPKASPEVVRAAYRSLMQRFHPDRRPGDAAAALRAAAITEAYDVLGDPARRAVYDENLAVRSPAAEPVFATAASGVRVHAPMHRRRSRSGWLWAVLVVPVVWGAAWLATPRQSALAQLIAIRQEFAAGGLPEARRRALHDQKSALLLQAPELHAQALAEAARDREARTVDLLEEPLVLPLEKATLSIPRLRLVLGSFDAPILRVRIDRQRAALQLQIAASVMRADVLRLAAPGGEAHLKALALGALADGLGTRADEDYPSTYFESPGRYGVVDVLLPEPFALHSN